jgi:ribonuclease P protein component
MRNRVKRRVREWFRRERHRLAAGAEVVVIARPGAAALETPEVAAGLEAALRNELEPARS